MNLSKIQGLSLQPLRFGTAYFRIPLLLGAETDPSVVSVGIAERSMHQRYEDVRKKLKALKNTRALAGLRITTERALSYSDERRTEQCYDMYVRLYHARVPKETQAAAALTDWLDRKNIPYQAITKADYEDRGRPVLSPEELV